LRSLQASKERLEFGRRRICHGLTLSYRISQIAHRLLHIVGPEADLEEDDTDQDFAVYSKLQTS
jgi:hypothetical protein